MNGIECTFENIRWQGVLITKFRNWIFAHLPCVHSRYKNVINSNSEGSKWYKTVWVWRIHSKCKGTYSAGNSSERSIMIFHSSHPKMLSLFYITFIIYLCFLSSVIVSLSILLYRCLCASLIFQADLGTHCELKWSVIYHCILTLRIGPGRSKRAPEDGEFYTQRQLSGLLSVCLFDCAYFALGRRLYLKVEQILLSFI